MRNKTSPQTKSRKPCSISDAVMRSGMSQSSCYCQCSLLVRMWTRVIDNTPSLCNLRWGCVVFELYLTSVLMNEKNVDSSYLIFLVLTGLGIVIVCAWSCSLQRRNLRSLKNLGALPSQQCSCDDIAYSAWSCDVGSICRISRRAMVIFSSMTA